jgi:hypothetical protein
MSQKNPSSIAMKSGPCDTSVSQCGLALANLENFGLARPRSVIVEDLSTSEAGAATTTATIVVRRAARGCIFFPIFTAVQVEGRKRNSKRYLRIVECSVDDATVDDREPSYFYLSEIHGAYVGKESLLSSMLN